MMSVLENPSEADAETSPSNQCRFVGIRRFDDFHTEIATDGDGVQLSPVFEAPIAWNELVVSWNTSAFEGTMKIEVRAIYSDHKTGFYTLGVWSASEQRHSERGQKDADGRVSTDTLVMQRPGAAVQLRIAWNDARPSLKFLGLSFLDNRARTGTFPENRTAWGKIIETPERSQHVIPGEEGWCSPASVSMILARWSEALRRPDLDIDVPSVAKAVIDTNYGTGNWPFNTAFAGGFDGMRAYVTRFSDISELEDWIVAGIPVIISAPWNLLHPGRSDTGSGHLVVCIGFTKNGDVVINDPATNLNAGQHVRHVYARQNVIDAWRKSRNT
ncbi:MAG TPA: C39 family peptidase, partial [Verrucomicrobiae bacterium]|nr:C39 family peptidase [Verrucomicrobiae bacterium]